MITAFVSCQNAPEADKAEANAPQEVDMTAMGSPYRININESKLTWTGTKPTGQHHGTVMMKNGELLADRNGITGGRFVFDMTTIAPYDQDEEGNTKLGNHLKSEDFFSVAEYPEGIFEITSVTPLADIGSDVKLDNATHTITGNLVLKGTSKSISFPARVVMDKTSLTAHADFNIDRTEWGINYQSDKSLGNKFINHEVNIKIELVANR